MAFKQVTIIGTGLIGGSLGLALKKRRLAGRIIGGERAPLLERAQNWGAMHKVEGVEPAAKSFGRNAGQRFLAGHPMAGKENAGVEFADADLFEGAAWLFTPLPRQNVHAGQCGEFIHCAEKMGAKIAVVDSAEHDRFCAWISHLPQMISTALAAALVDEFGPDAPVLDIGGRALCEMTRISGSPYSMWRDIAITNRKNLSDALQKLEQRLAHIRENLDSRELAAEFERAHQLRKSPPRKRGGAKKIG